jgi:outer membrane biosynthesis protein TonB
MLTVKSEHNRPVRVGRLLWRPNQTHPVQEHWLNKSVMRALIKKGWLVVLEASPAPQPPEPAPVKKPVKTTEPVVQDAPKKPLVVANAHGPVNLSPDEPVKAKVPEIIPDEDEDEPVEVPEEVPAEVPEEKPEEVPTEAQEEAQLEKPEREPEAVFPTREELEQMAFAQLRELGKKWGVSARARSDLIDRIEKAQLDGK